MVIGGIPDILISQNIVRINVAIVPIGISREKEKRKNKMFHGLTFFGIPIEYFLRLGEIIILAGFGMFITAVTIVTRRIMKEKKRNNER